MAIPIFRGYGSYEARPAHPETGALADYYAEFPGGRRVPQWSNGKARLPKGALVTPKELADACGKKRPWVYSLIRRKLLPAVRPPGTKEWLIRAEDVAAFIAGQSAVAPLPEPVTEGERR